MKSISCVNELRFAKLKDFAYTVAALWNFQHFSILDVQKLTFEKNHTVLPYNF